MKIVNAFFALATASFVAASALTGCAADTTEGADDGVDPEVTTDELTAAGKKLIGAYKDDSGAFKGLVLTDEKVGARNKFFADVDTGIRCITTPCPSAERIEGTFTAGTKTITLYSTSAVNAKHLLGKYNYLVQGSKLTLSRKGFSQSLSKEISYCAAPADCYRQAIIHPMCLGAFTCGSENTCSWKCGSLPVDSCKGKTQAACLADEKCQPVYGPRPCPPGMFCPADVIYVGCETRPAEEPPPAGPVCLSSSSCKAGEHCSTEDGVCNPYGMLAVCAGNCVANNSK